MSLRLAGWPVTGADVRELYFYTASGPDDGASIEDTLDAAAEFGLAGRLLESRDPRYDLAMVTTGARGALGLILGVDLPGPHAILATPDGWWSWGELYDPAQFPGAVIEEAWAVTWG